MNRSIGLDRPWRMAIVAVAALLVAIVFVGAVGIAINRGVQDVVERAIEFDVELEDNADDLRVAVLDVRHYHRDILFHDPVPARVSAWEERYHAMVAQIDELEALIADGVDPQGLPSILELRTRAQDYYAAFRAALDAYDADEPQPFIESSEAGLADLNTLESLAAQYDSTGEARATDAFRAIDSAVAGGTWALVAVIAGLIGLGAGLGLTMLRMMHDTRRLVAAEQDALHRLADAFSAKSDFIADASHELRTPLTVLRGNAEVGLAINDQCDHAEILREIVTESATMSRLVDDLLFLARSDAASVPLNLKRVQAGALFRDVAAHAQVLAREHGASLVVRHKADGWARVDAPRIEQAVLILVDNAAKYSPPGGAVELRSSSDGRWLVVEVADEGPGIPAEELPHVFERFYRGRRQDGRRTPGAGLGLPIASAIVAGHGGAIDARSNPGEGTTMTIRIPLEPLVAEPVAPLKRKARPARGGAR